jgi:hypothetical protein
MATAPIRMKQPILGSFSVIIVHTSFQSDPIPGFYDEFQPDNIAEEPFF